MIFVTVGSQKFPFDRLVKKADQMVKEKVITEEVFIQTGNCRYIPQYCSYQAFYHRNAFIGMIEQCSVLITHGGAGTMVDAVRRGKKTIVVPRLAKYGEHVNDHQLQLAKKFYEMNLVYACRDLNRLPEMLIRIQNHNFNTYPSNTEDFLASVDDFILSQLACGLKRNGKKYEGFGNRSQRYRIPGRDGGSNPGDSGK